MGAVVHCDYDGLDALDINEAILSHNMVEVFGSEVGGKPYCSVSGAIIGREDVRADFHGAIIKPTGDFPVVEMRSGFSIQNAVVQTNGVEGYEGPAIAFAGEFVATRPTNIQDVTVLGSLEGVGVALIGDKDTSTRKITHVYMKGLHIHNYAVGLLLRDVNPLDNMDYINANFYQGRIIGSLRAIELEHANGNDITIDWQPGQSSLSGLRCFACTHNRINGMFWDAHIAAEKALQLDADSRRNRVWTPLVSPYIQDDGTENVIQ